MDAIVIIVGSLIGTKAFWDLLQLIVNRKGRKAEIARQESTVEIEKEKSKTDVEHAKVLRLQAIAELRAEGQEEALRAWKTAYERLEADTGDCRSKYERCHTELETVYDVAVTLTDVIAAFVAKMRATADESSDLVIMKVTSQEFLDLRKAVQHARIHLK